VQAIGANTFMSLLLTTTSNVLAVATVPYIVAFVFTRATTVTFDPADMVQRLVTTVLVPLAIGALLRSFPKVCY
jgi:predicted Na+-dependent transporter